MEATMAHVKLLGLSGALRKGSTNTLLLQEAARLMGDAELTLADLNLPLYDGDLEAAEGVPAAVQKLAAQISEADAVVISTPEYNRGLSGVVKNALDWVSRVEGSAWAGKPVALMSSAAGALWWRPWACYVAQLHDTLSAQNCCRSRSDSCGKLQ